MNTVTIKINGIEYNLRGRENEEYLVKIAKYVDSKVRDITNVNKKLSTTASATLASLNIADELFKADIEIENLIKKTTSLEQENISLEEKVKQIKDELEKNKFNSLREVESLNKQLEEINSDKLEDYEKTIERLKNKLENLEKENTELRSYNEVLKDKEIDTVDEINQLKIDFKSIEENFNKANLEKEKLKARNKDIKFQLQTSKYKVLDLEKRLIDTQVELAKEKRFKNPLKKEV